MPNYDYLCNGCGSRFEKRLTMDEIDTPKTEPCPECSVVGTVDYVPTFSGLGDPIRLGITKPPGAFINGVLGRMENSIPAGTKEGSDGIRRVQHVKFNGRYSPGRSV